MVPSGDQAGRGATKPVCFSCAASDRPVPGSHSCMLPSAAMASSRPLGAHATMESVVHLSSSGNSRRHSPDCGSHTLILPRRLVARARPSGDQQRPVNGSVPSGRIVRRTIPSTGSWRMTLSPVIEASNRPLGDHASRAAESAKLPTTRDAPPEARSQRRIVLSPAHEASCRPSGDQARCRTTLAWPWSLLTKLPETTSHNSISFSSPATAR